MSLLKLKTGDPKAMTPTEFFEAVCPKVLAVHAPICKQLGGSYAFQVLGQGGGAWTLDYGATLVHSGALPGADLLVEMSAHDFTDLLKGTLDVEKAADEGRVRIKGDAKLFGNLAAVLAPVEV
ncbi:MAG TPA: SCP2 sterol-binding domain-containing protein [Myxococcota bacterium]|jgi:hypothetical protein